MTIELKQMTDFIRAVGADEIEHSEKSYLAHAIGVHNDLKSWGGDDDSCKAAVFHSIYGTAKFQKFTLPLERRGEVRELIGDKAERIAYLNCAMDREHFDAEVVRGEGPFRLLDRFTGEEIPLADDEFDDLCRLHLCDWLEQVERSRDWDYRRDAYRQMAERLGGVAAAAYQRVFAAEVEAS